MVAASSILHQFGALVVHVLRNENYVAARCIAHMTVGAVCGCDMQDQRSVGKWKKF